MKAFTCQISVLSFFVGILLPAAAFGFTLKPAKSPDVQQPMLLAQSADPEQLALASWKQFSTIYEQLGTLKDKNQIIQALESLTSVSRESTQHQDQLVKWWQQQVMPTQPLAIFVSQISQHEAEKLQTMQEWSQVLPKVLSAIQVGNQAAVNQLLQGDIRVLNNRMAMHRQKAQQLPQLWAVAKAGNQAEMSRMIMNFSNVQSQGIAERGRAAKCMVSSSPYGSAAQVASNPSAFCNAP